MKTPEILANGSLLSKTIRLVRFPLIVGVVFAHNAFQTLRVGGSTVSTDMIPWLSCLSRALTSILPFLVPCLFFFISGFLFFRKPGFDKAMWRKNLESRVRSLLIPYLLWNFIGFLVLLVELHPRFASVFPQLKDYRLDIVKFLGLFWGRPLYDSSTVVRLYPIDFPLWFLRELMLMCLAAPLVHWCIARMKWFFVAAVGAGWFFGLWQTPLFEPRTVFFFSFGACCGIHGVDFAERARRAGWALWAYPLLVALELLAWKHGCRAWIHRTGLLVGGVAAVCIAARLAARPGVAGSRFLDDATFFVFALHGLFMPKFKKAVVLLSHPTSPLLQVFLLFFIPVATIAVCLVAYAIVAKCCPSLASVLSGGRKMPRSPAPGGAQPPSTVPPAAPAMQ
jgi:fucose 4-O-acetylase-like acetyltransferase